MWRGMWEDRGVRTLIRAAVFAAFVAGCSGNGNPATTTPAAATTVPTAAPTAAPPSVVPPTAALFSITDLIAAPHPVTTDKQMEAAIQAALSADPFLSAPGTQSNLKACETGVSDTPSDTVVATRASGCILLIATLHEAYCSDAAQADYEAALAVYNYAIQQALGYPAATGAQPSDSVATWVSYLNGQLHVYSQCGHAGG
jgi:hypothetical protein